MAAAEGPLAEFSCFANFEERKRKWNLLMSLSNGFLSSKKKKNVFSLLSADSRYFRIYAVKYAKLAAARVFKKATAALSNILNHEGHLLSRLFYNIAPNC